MYALHGKYGMSLPSSRMKSVIYTESTVTHISGQIFFHHLEWALQMISEHVYWEKQEHFMPQALPKTSCRLLLRRWFRDKFHRSKETDEIHEYPALC